MVRDSDRLSGFAGIPIGFRFCRDSDRLSGFAGIPIGHRVRVKDSDRLGLG